MSLCDWILGCCCCCSSFIKLCWYIHTVFLYIPLFLLIIIQLALIGSWVLSAVGLIYHTAALLFLLFKQEPPPPPTSQPASPKDIEDRQAYRGEWRLFVPFVAKRRGQKRKLFWSGYCFLVCIYKCADRFRLIHPWKNHRHRDPPSSLVRSALDLVCRRRDGSRDAGWMDGNKKKVSTFGWGDAMRKSARD